MPVNVKIIRMKEFIKTTPTGVLDLAASKLALLEVASMIKQPSEYDVLVDTREAEVILSIINLYQLGEALANHPSLGSSKICLLAPMKDVDKANFLETVAVNRGARIKAFTNFEEALNWLVLREVS